MHRRKSVADAFGCRHLNRFLSLRQRKRRNVLFNQVLGAIQQDAGGLAGLFVAQESPIHRVLRIFVDARTLQRLLVCPRGEAVETDEKDRIVWRRRTQGLIVGIVRGPLSFVPSPTDNPFSGCCVRCALPDQGHGRVLVGNVLQVQSQQALAQRQQMSVGVNQSGQDRSAVQIDNLGGVGESLSGLDGCAKPGDAISFYSDGFSSRTGAVDGHDVGVD